MTLSATLGQAFSLDEAFSGTIGMPYVTSMLVLYIRMRRLLQVLDPSPLDRL
jgi:hypothetical protein